MMKNSSVEPQIAKDSVLVKSAKLPDATPMVKGYDWNNGLDYDRLLDSYKHCGFQATNFGNAIDEINKMVCTKLISYQLPYVIIFYRFQ